MNHGRDLGMQNSMNLFINLF